MRGPWLLVLAAMSIASAGARPARAQVGAHFETIESLAARADAIVRGRIVEVAREPGDPDAAVRDAKPLWATVAVHVAEAIKGEPWKSVSFTVDVRWRDERYEQWRDAGQEQLWFLARNPRHKDAADARDAPADARHPWVPLEGGWGLIRLGEAVPAEKGFSQLPPPIFTMSLDVLTDAKAIVEATKVAAAAVKGKGRVELHSVWLPRGVAERSGRSGDANGLSVPVDERLERLALRLIRAPDELLGQRRPRAEEGDRLVRPARRPGAATEADLLRAEGVRALRFFKSDEHAALLRGLLDDPAWLVRVSPDGTRQREHPVRLAAAEVLKAWDAAATAPARRGEGQAKP